MPHGNPENENFRVTKKIPRRFPFSGLRPEGKAAGWFPSLPFGWRGGKTLFMNLSFEVGIFSFPGISVRSRKHFKISAFKSEIVFFWFFQGRGDLKSLFNRLF